MRLALLLPLALAACIPAGRSSGGGEVSPPSPGETSACFADLRDAGVAFRALPDRETGLGCGLFGTVQLTDIGTPVGGLTAVRCRAARGFAAWVREDVGPAAERLLGSPLARIDTAGSYACRNVIGSARNASRRSGHAIANAIDVTGFRLRDGRRVTVLAGWNAPDEATQDFLRTVRRAACRRFVTVLSPDYNAAHVDHLHLEADRAGLCR